MKRNNSLDGLRAWAIASVFMVHFNPTLPNFKFSQSLFNDYLSSVLNFIFIGPFGVDIFFALSGFLMTGVLVSERFTVASFFSSRLRRLFPAHFFVLAMQLTSHSLLVGFLNLFFLAYLFDNIPLLNFVEWSLTYEFLFYLFIAILIASTRSIAKIFLLTFTSLLFIVFASFWFENIDGIVINHIRIPMLRITPFLFGILIFCCKSLNPVNFITRIIYSLSISYPLIIMWLVNYYGRQSNQNIKITIYLLILLSTSCLIFSMTNQKLAVTRFFSMSKFVSLGKISYSFYLAHSIWAIPIAANIIKPFPFLHGYMQYYLVSMSTSVWIALYMYKYLEKPYFLKSRLTLQS